MRKSIRYTLPAIKCTPRYKPLLKVKLHLTGEEVEAIVDTVVSAAVVEKRLACKLGIWKRARKDKVRQGDGNLFSGNFVVNATF